MRGAEYVKERGARWGAPLKDFMIILEDYEVEFIKLALNDALDSTKNKARFKIYTELLKKLGAQK